MCRTILPASVRCDVTKDKDVRPISRPKAISVFARYGSSRDTERPFFVITMSSPALGHLIHQLQTVRLDSLDVHAL